MRSIPVFISSFIPPLIMQVLYPYLSKKEEAIVALTPVLHNIVYSFSLANSVEYYVERLFKNRFSDLGILTLYLS